MKQKIFMLIVSILLLDIRKSNAAVLNLGTAEIVLIFISCMFFIGIVGGIILVCLHLAKKAKTTKNEY